MKRPISLTAVPILFAALAFGAPVHADQARVTEVMTGLVQAPPDAVDASEMEGWFEVTYGTQVLLVREDGRYLMEGNLIDIESRRNLTADRRASVVSRILGQVPTDEMVVYPAETERPRHVVTVFTDVDCPFCQKLHDEVPALNAQGVEVRYVAFVRAGEGSPTHRKMAGIWCADDRRAAMDRVKSGGNQAAGNCNNPVMEQTALGQMLGVRGTPAIVTAGGEIIPGYLPAAQLISELEQR